MSRGRLLSRIGPGIAVAATGVGAGDIVSAAVAGSRFGLVVVWAALLGALLKFILAEGVARWQLATGTTILEGWITRLARPVRIYFLIYMIIWSFVVGGALISACGLAAHALAPGVSYIAWGWIHSLVAVVFVWFGRYTLFENAMKLFVGMMFVGIVASFAQAGVPIGELMRGLTVPRVPSGSIGLLLAVIGGVGGTITLLSYSYWLREKGWNEARHLPFARLDLGLAYLVTGIFGVATISLAAVTLFAAGIEVEGRNAALRMAEMLGERGGMASRLFLIGFWGAVASSLVGVWQSVPYLYTEYVRLARGGDVFAAQKSRSARARSGGPGGTPVDPTRTVHYRVYLLYLAIPPIALLYMAKPVWLVILYAVVGSFFMPFLAGTLLYMLNRREWMGTHRNGIPANAGLAFALGLFAYLAIAEIVKRVGS